VLLKIKKHQKSEMLNFFVHNLQMKVANNPIERRKRLFFVQKLIFNQFSPKNFLFRFHYPHLWLDNLKSGIFLSISILQSETNEHICKQIKPFK